MEDEITVGELIAKLEDYPYDTPVSEAIDQETLARIFRVGFFYVDDGK